MDVPVHLKGVDWTRWPLKIPSNSNNSMILWPAESETPTHALCVCSAVRSRSTIKSNSNLKQLLIIKEEWEEDWSLKQAQAKRATDITDRLWDFV